MPDPALRVPPARELQRLSPALYIVELVQLLTPAACFTTAFLLVRVVGGRAWSMIAVITFYCCWSVFFATRRILTSGYRIDGDELLIREGPSSRAARVIRIADLTEVELYDTPLLRTLGIVNVRLATRHVGDPDVVFSFLRRAAAEKLQADLVARNPDINGAATKARPEGNVLTAATLRDLVVHGITENRAGVILFIVYLIGQVVRGQSDQPQRPLEILLASLVGWNSTAITLKLIIAVLVLFHVGFLFSTALTLAEFRPYCLFRNGGELRRRYGHLTRHESIFRIRDIQALRFESVPIRQGLGVWNIEGITAGNPRTGERGRSNPLFLRADMKDWQDYCNRIFEDFVPAPLQRAGENCFRRWFGAYVLPGVVVGLLAGWRVHWTCFLIAPIWLLSIALIAWARTQVIGYAESGRYLITQSGVWTRNRFIIPIENIQYVRFTESASQRRLGLASLTIGFAGSGKYSQAPLPDLPCQTAMALRDRLLANVTLAGPWAGLTPN